MPVTGVRHELPCQYPPRPLHNRSPSGTSGLMAFLELEAVSADTIKTHFSSFDEPGKCPFKRIHGQMECPRAQTLDTPTLGAVEMRMPGMIAVRSQTIAKGTLP